jgi:hypothetical protein
MSCYEWEAGTIVLPTAAVTAVKRAVKDAALAHRRRLYDEAQRFWEALPRRHRANAELYRRAASAFLYGNEGRHGDALDGLPRWPGVAGSDTQFAEDLDHLLACPADGKPRRARLQDASSVCPVPAGANPAYRCGEAGLRFEGRKAHWRVPENNHAREHAHDHPLAIAFFRALDRVHWTRGSGGHIVGNDEYNRDSGYEGGGANYVTARYGPEPAGRRRRSR